MNVSGDQNEPALSEPAASKPEPVPAVGQPVLRLRWDFRTRFPRPLPDAVDAGIMDAEDTKPKSIEAIHATHGRKMLEALSDLDAAMDTRRKDQTPNGLARPTHDRLSEPTRLERWYSSLLGVYEDWFGKEATDAFDRAVRAWHAHVEVVVDRDADGSTSIADMPATQVPSHITSPAISEDIIDVEVSEPSRPTVAPPSRRLSAPAERRIISRLPVPRPRRHAIAAGHFGEDEKGPVDPSPAEVREITENHAAELIELLEVQRQYQKPGAEADEARVSVEISHAVQKYAEDFGERAGQQLLAYARRQLRLNEAPDSGNGRGRTR